ncbi:hypothetical protein HDF19_10345 [Mucilaginibacter sp. E4BP6]|uniref:hypothetical protein n=1 Tax=Mucilaginibacter sp. E4BP6 TaxID=2723089 RepID=UPI0015CA02FC|nr:hypothetical protein [Mucilaginibacter sp. E4BP6]NYE65452.1 Ca2+/Na+ antiporter [Mucilaginibacter sp. E4BP6]
MEIEYQNTKKDFVDYFKTILKERFKKSILFMLLMLAFLLYFLYDSKCNWYVSLIIIAIILIFISTLSYFLPLWKFTNKIDRSIKSKPNYAEPRIVTLTDDGIKTEGKKSGTSILRTWDDIISIKLTEQFIFISTKSKENLLLSERWFSSKNEVSKFINSVQSRINVGTPNFFVNKTTRSYKTIKPRYLIGFLCLIPLIGAFVGIGMMIYGLFVYKDKWVVFIGAVGILFTVAIFKSMDYSATNNPQFKKAWAETDKGELNSLVKQIEFYKIQNGTYPDSLKQMDFKGEIANESDPLLIFSGDKNGVYNYHKIGKKYTLFSSGIDKTPNTADDIYPSLQIDTNKIGLIINRR